MSGEADTNALSRSVTVLDASRETVSSMNLSWRTAGREQSSLLSRSLHKFAGLTVGAHIF